MKKLCLVLLCVAAFLSLATAQAAPSPLCVVLVPEPSEGADLSAQLTITNIGAEPLAQITAAVTGLMQSRAELCAVQIAPLSGPEAEMAAPGGFTVSALAPGESVALLCTWRCEGTILTGETLWAGAQISGQGSNETVYAAGSTLLAAPALGKGEQAAGPGAIIVSDLALATCGLLLALLVAVAVRWRRAA